MDRKLRNLDVKGLVVHCLVFVQLFTAVQNKCKSSINYHFYPVAFHAVDVSVNDCARCRATKNKTLHDLPNVI